MSKISLKTIATFVGGYLLFVFAVGTLVLYGPSKEIQGHTAVLKIQDRGEVEIGVGVEVEEEEIVEEVLVEPVEKIEVVEEVEVVVAIEEKPEVVVEPVLPVDPAHMTHIFEAAVGTMEKIAEVVELEAAVAEVFEVEEVEVIEEVEVAKLTIKRPVPISPFQMFSIFSTLVEIVNEVEEEIEAELFEAGAFSIDFDEPEVEEVEAYTRLVNVANLTVAANEESIRLKNISLRINGVGDDSLENFVVVYDSGVEIEGSIENGYVHFEGVDKKIWPGYEESFSFYADVSGEVESGDSLTLEVVGSYDVEVTSRGEVTPYTGRPGLESPALLIK